MSRIAVVGTTGWGTTLAVLAARNGCDTLLLARTSEEASTLTSAGENARHRPGLRFPDTLTVSADASDLHDASCVMLVVPSASLSANLARVLPHIDPEATIVSAIKGIEEESGRRTSEVIAERGVAADRLAALSGPNFAGEIAAGLPAATVVAGPDARRTADVQSVLNSGAFRVYTSDDIVGAEVGGALKNVVAIACGMSDGLGFGENAKAGLITRALAEITRLGVALGARPMTFLGLAGIGDLVLSCGSDLSRNRRLGIALARGLTLDQAIASIDGVVEGVLTAHAIPVLTRRAGVEMPICEALHAVLYGGLPVKDAALALMARSAKPEFADR